MSSNGHSAVQARDRRIEERYDIVVCGGGLAGLCAAVAAARLGASVCLVQDRPVFGGNSSSEIRVPPQGAASFHAYARETGIISELLIEERARNHEEPTFDNGWINSIWDMVQYDMVMNTPNLTFHLNTSVIDVQMRNESTVEAVVARVQHAETELVLHAETFVDCTGDGVIAALAGCEWRIGTESRSEYGEPHAPEEASDAVMGSSLHFKAKDMGRPVPFTPPSWAVRYEDPDFFYKQGRWPGEIRSGHWWIELSVPWHTIYDNETLRHELTRHVLGVWDWIKNRDPVLKVRAANYALDWIGQVPGKRESRRIVGQYWMTEHDPLNKTIFEDEIAYGGWFVDLHEPGGLLAPFSERTAAEGHDGAYAAKSYVGPYGIPLRILIAKDKSNLMMAGRNVSVTHAALGTVRVMGTTALMGQAAGTAAAVAKRLGLDVAEMGRMPGGDAVKQVQQCLLREGCFLLNNRNEDPDDLARRASIRVSSEMRLTGAEPPDVQDPDAEGAVADAERLTNRRSQWIATGGDRIDEIAVCLSNDADETQDVELRLYAPEHIWDYRTEPGDVLDRTVIKVAPGTMQWVVWPVRLLLSSAGVRAGSYVRLDLMANNHVRWHAAQRVVPGMVSAYEAGGGSLRRYGSGATMSFRIEPPQACYGGEQLKNGVTRPYRSTNMWRSDPGQPLPQWLELSWREPVTIKCVELTFPGHLLRDYRTYPAFFRDPEIPKHVKLEAEVNGSVVEVGELTDNYQRRRVVELREPIRTSKLRVVVLATNGDVSAAVSEVRCY